MKLFLTSAGFPDEKLSRFFIDKLDHSPEKLHTVMIALINNPEEQVYVDLSKKELENLGFHNIKFINLSSDSSSKDIQDSDLIYVCGGNTFAIYKRLKESGLSSTIEKLVWRSKSKGNINKVGVC